MGSILNRIFGIFRWPNPSGRAVAAGSIQPLTEMCMKDFPWVLSAAGA
jgi:hypothetical protein